MDFGLRLKELRTQKKLTQSQMAEILDISKSNISKYEAGSIEPNLETLMKISKYFDVSIDYLLGKETSLNLPDNNSNEEKRGFFFFFFDDLLKDVFTARLKKAMESKESSDNSIMGSFPIEEGKMQSFINGDREPSLEELVAISQALEVTIDYLLGQVNTREEKLLHNFRYLNEDNQDIIIGEIKKCLKEQRYESVAADSDIKQAK